METILYPSDLTSLCDSDLLCIVLYTHIGVVWQWISVAGRQAQHVCRLFWLEKGGCEAGGKSNYCEGKRQYMKATPILYVCWNEQTKPAILYSAVLPNLCNKQWSIDTSTLYDLVI